jgi:hypothetical protein
VINVHLQPHTHNDLGWLKTFDEYLTGSNNTIQAAGVKWIYDSVVTSLLRNPDRRFISVEMGFLMRWLDLQPPSVVAQVQQLVAEDRLQLCNAGWTMNDEATVGFADAVDQYSLGARLANKTFGPASAARVAWSIDRASASSLRALAPSRKRAQRAVFRAHEDLRFFSRDSSLTPPAPTTHTRSVWPWCDARGAHVAVGLERFFLRAPGLAGEGVAACE